MPRWVRKQLVAGEERRVQRLGERDVSRVASGQVAAKLPHARQEEFVGIAVKGERGKVVERLAGTIGGDLACRRISAQDRSLDVDEMRRVERFSRGEHPIFDGWRSRGAQKRFEQRRSVDDDHSESRSARTASACSGDGDDALRVASRARNSSIVGRSAPSRISASKYSESDCPASAARDLSRL